MKQKFLAAQAALVVTLVGGSLTCPPPASAQIAVIDSANAVLNMTTSIESMAQTLKQIDQYKTQLQQYENMLQNTTDPETHIWDQAQTTINDLMNAVGTLNHYKTQLGSLDSYLGKFQDVAYYRNAPCLNGSGGCTPTEKTALEENRRMGSESQKNANDALFRVIDTQQDALKGDAQQLQRLQSAAQGASGQLQAIGYANQLASQQANQLLQIRGLLIAQQNALATRMQVEADREARQQAASESLYKGEYRASQARNW